MGILCTQNFYWEYLLYQLVNKPSEWGGAAPHPDDYTPDSPPSTPPCTPTSPPQRPHTNTYSPSNPPPSPPPSLPMPPRQPPPPPRQSYRNEWNYNPDGVGRNRIYSFGILKLNNTATEREIKLQYRRLAIIYHPNKYNGTKNPTTKTESQEHFKLINNAYEYLRTFYKFRITYVCRSHRLYILSNRDYYYYYYIQILIFLECTCMYYFFNLAGLIHNFSPLKI